MKKRPREEGDEWRNEGRNVATQSKPRERVRQRRPLVISAGYPSSEAVEREIRQVGRQRDTKTGRDLKQVFGEVKSVTVCGISTNHPSSVIPSSSRYASRSWRDYGGKRDHRDLGWTSANARETVASETSR